MEEREQHNHYHHQSSGVYPQRAVDVGAQFLGALSIIVGAQLSKSCLRARFTRNIPPKLILYAPVWACLGPV